jgi:hypothetical protein
MGYILADRDSRDLKDVSQTIKARFNNIQIIM